MPTQTRKRKYNGEANKKSKVAVAKKQTSNKDNKAADDASNVAFDEKLTALRTFKEEHGHVNVPPGEYKELNKWIMNQRYLYKSRLEGKTNSLTPGRIQILEDLGFTWTVKGRRANDDEGGKFLSNEEKWERNIEELKKFKAKFGHCNVSKTGEYIELGSFVGQQRYFYRRRLKGETTSLTDERIKILSNLGFQWKVPLKEDDGISSLRTSVTSKTKDNHQVVEKGKEITLPDGSTIEIATKESSQKRLVLLEDGSHALDITTKTYTTKIEKTVLPSEVAQGEVNDTDVSFDKPPPYPGVPDDVESNNTVTYPDGSTVSSTSQGSTKKRMVVLENGMYLLEITSTTCVTKVERSHLETRLQPPKSE